MRCERVSNLQSSLGRAASNEHLNRSRRSRTRALAYNGLSALTCLPGGLATCVASASIDLALRLPFAAGNFIYIAPPPPADLVPESKRRTTPKATVIDVRRCTLGLAVLLGSAIRHPALVLIVSNL